MAKQSRKLKKNKQVAKYLKKEAKIQRKNLFRLSVADAGLNKGIITSIYRVATSLMRSDGYDWLAVATKYINKDSANASISWCDRYFSEAAGYDDTTATTWTTDASTGRTILEEWRLDLEENNEI